MATKNEKKAADTGPVAVQQEAKPMEDKYFIGELVEQHKMFSTSKELVLVALKRTGKDSFTVNEARTIIEVFKSKEVK